jgi:predicted permease
LLQLLIFVTVLLAGPLSALLWNNKWLAVFILTSTVVYAVMWCSDTKQISCLPAHNLDIRSCVPFQLASNNIDVQSFIHSHSIQPQFQ